MTCLYDSKSYATYVIPTVISRLYKPSLELLQEAKRKDEEQKRLAKSKVESLAKEPLEPSSIENENASPVETNEGPVEHEPVYVIIDGAEVDIGGTDIDAEFLSVFPDDMRARSVCSTRSGTQSRGYAS